MRLDEYVLVSQHVPKIEVFRRPERGHRQRDEARGGETIVIHGCTISVDEIYRRANA